MSEKPYLSVCMGIGGNFKPDLLDRLVDSLRANQLLASQYHIDAEWVICDWGQKIPSSFVAQFPSGMFPIRVINVPQSVHDSLPNPHRMPYFEFQPKNVAIRRARGEWVLSTNPDDLWSIELADFFCRRLLQRGHFYRINRHDTKDGKVYRVCYETGCFAPGERHDIPMPRASAPGGLHMNGSGDFLLMHREEWAAIHGHPEQPYSHTVDGQSVYLAQISGLKQIILQQPIYHPDHERTLNLNVDGQFVGPEWDDHKPFTKQNGEEWGCAGMEFQETCL